MPQKTKIYIIDDHPIIDKGLRKVITQVQYMQVVGSVENAKTALADIAKLRPEVVMEALTHGMQLPQLANHLYRRSDLCASGQSLKTTKKSY